MDQLVKAALKDKLIPATDANRLKVQKKQLLDMAVKIEFL
jgi:hypothetical protein